MMLRTQTDQLNLASRTQALVERLYPGERVLFSTAVTILETRHESPTGWSFQRFFQRRGNVVVTDARIFIQSSFFSVLTLIWLALFLYSGYRINQDASLLNVAVAIVAVVFVVQRRPYSRDLPFESIVQVRFGNVRGLAARCDIVSVVVDGRAIQLVTAQFVTNDMRQRLMALGDATAKV